MQSTIYTKQMIDFQKTTFDNSFYAVTLLQEQTEKMTRSFLDQAIWLPAEGRKAVDEWIKAFNKGRNDFKKTVDENFKKMEKMDTFFFATQTKGGKAKTKKAPNPDKPAA